MLQRTSSSPQPNVTTASGSALVPILVGRTEADAKKVLDSAGLKSTVARVQSDLVAGQVISQEPKAGTEANAGSTITLQVSAGPTPVDLPDVRGRDVDAATEALDAAGFNVKVNRQASDNVRPDAVIDQDPKPGKAPKGSTVTLLVSSGREQVQVPDVSGKDEASAANALGQAGFESTTQTQASDSVDKGNVIRTQPAGGTPLAKGSTVTMFVSSGTPPPTLRR